MPIRARPEKSGTHMTGRMVLAEAEACTKEAMAKEMLAI